MIEAHKASNQFFCPKTFDLSVYNTFDNIESKVVNVYMKGCDQGTNDLCKLETNTLRDYFDNKMIMLLTNSQHVDFSLPDTTEPIQQSYLHWIPFLYGLPETTRVSMQRYKYVPDEFHIQKMLGFAESSFEYWSVLRDQAHWVTEFYDFEITKPENWV